MGRDGPAGAADLEELYAAAYGPLVAVVATICGSVPDAEECVQEAFVRLIGRWDQVQRYDDPEAWLRKVSLGFASNRRRKARNAVRARWRHGPASNVPALSADAVDIARGLAALPFQQRQVLVLQHFVGLDVEAIARELDVPAGTVKSRLARGRAALAPHLSEQEAHRG